MLGAPSSFVNNKNVDVEVRTHGRITLPLSFLLIEVLSGVFSCFSLLRHLGSRGYISFTYDFKSVIYSSDLGALSQKQICAKIVFSCS